MFRLTLLPQAADKNTEISVQGQTLIVDGQAIDFSPLGVGQQCETEMPLHGIARRFADSVEVSIVLQYDSATAEPMQSTNPNDYIVLVSDGPVPDVIRRLHVQEIPEMDTRTHVED